MCGCGLFKRGLCLSVFIIMTYKALVVSEVGSQMVAKEQFLF